MKLNKEQLKRIIKEELEAVMNEDQPGYDRDDKKKEYEKEWSSKSARGGKYLDDDGYDRPRKNDFDRQRDAEEGEGMRNQWDAEERETAADSARAKRSRQSRAEIAQNDADRGQMIKAKLFPWMEKNAGSLYKKAGAPTEKDFLRNVSRSKDMSDEELGASEGYSAIQDMLGVNLMQSIIKGRSGWKKLGGLLKRGTFSEQLDRRMSQRRNSKK